MVCMAEAVVTEKLVSMLRHHRSQEGISACWRLGINWLCAGGTGSKVLGIYANRDPLVTLSHVLIILPHKKTLLLQFKSRS